MLRLVHPIVQHEDSVIVVVFFRSTMFVAKDSLFARYHLVYKHMSD